MTLLARLRAARDPECGSALVEFLALSLLLLIPIIYLILTLTRLHAGQFAAASAAHSAARVFVTADSETKARENALLATRIALNDQGFTDVAVAETLTIDCSGAACLRPNTDITFTVSIPVTVPGIPFLDEGIRVLTATESQVASTESHRSQP